MTTYVIATGGTFEKHYDEIKGQLVFTKTHITEMLKRARVTKRVKVDTIALVDSLDMTNAQRRAIVNAVKKTRAKKVVIIHGTDTMTVTAQELLALSPNKTVVLTGAMIPYEFDGSDALFNLGHAMGVCETLPSGVYVAMNGQVFPANNVKKNKQKGCFEKKGK